MLCHAVRSWTPRCVMNAVRSFSGIQFLLAGLSLPLKGMHHKNVYIGVLYKPRPLFII